MANKKLSAVITIGGAVASSLRSAFGTVTGETNRIGRALRNLEGQQRHLSRSIQEFGRLGKNVDGLRGRYAAVTAEVEKLRKAQQRIQGAHSGMEAGKARMASAGLALGATAAAAATAFIPIAQAASFETAMLGVAKQVDGARDKAGNLTQVYFDMARQVQLLGRELPIATNDIADMVAAGSRMGVAKDELIGFTRTAAMMAEAFELPAGELADQMGKVAQLFKIPIPAIGELADSINYLDDNAISKGGDIIEFMTRTGGVASSVKITGKEMAALGSTLLTLGERTETAGTATNAMFQKLAAADKGTKKFKAAMAEIGLSTAAVQKGMQTDATGTLMKVLEKIGKLPKDKQLGVMVELVGLEHSDTMAKLANNVGEYRRQLELANGEGAKGSMSREFQARMQTTNAQWTVFKNRITEVGVNIGGVLLPPLNTLMGWLSVGTSAVGDFVRENKLLVTNLVTMAGVLGTGYVVCKNISMGLGLVTFAFNALKLAIAAHPVALMFSLLATAAVLIWQNWEPIKAFFLDLWAKIREPALKTWETIKQLWLDFTPIGLVVKNWEPIKGFFSSLWADITDSARRAMDWILGKIEALGQAWTKTKAYFGIGDEEAPKQQPASQFVPGVSPLPKVVPGIPGVVAIRPPVVSAGEGKGGAAGALGVPGSIANQGQPVSSQTLPAVMAPAPPQIPMAAPRGNASSYTDNSQTTIHVTQQPGENSRDLARRITEEQERRRAVQRRGGMYDGATTN